MTQAERDRLVALKKGQKENDYSEAGGRGTGNHRKAGAASARGLKRRGDKAVVHALRGLPAFRRTSIIHLPERFRYSTMTYRS